MKISIVTISYNQAEFLPACLESVAAQEGSFEHIIVDPGSTDGSRDIIEANREHFSHIILERDNGPADGLNKGFSFATGELYYYLNSDDIVLPGAFSDVRKLCSSFPKVDVFSGGGYIIDEAGIKNRKLWSDSVTRCGLSHGGSILIQPSTFIRRSAFERTSGFNSTNRSNWDGELIVDLFEKGANFKQINKFWSGYRIHGQSITGNGNLNREIREFSKRIYRRIMKKDRGQMARVIIQIYRAKRIFRHPEILWQRMLFGPVYGAKKK